MIIRIPFTKKAIVLEVMDEVNGEILSDWLPDWIDTSCNPHAGDDELYVNAHGYGFDSVEWTAFAESEAHIAYHESGAEYDPSIDEELWTLRWMEQNSQSLYEQFAKMKSETAEDDIDAEIDAWRDAFILFVEGKAEAHYGNLGLNVDQTRIREYFDERMFALDEEWFSAFRPDNPAPTKAEIDAYISALMVSE